MCSVHLDQKFCWNTIRWRNWLLRIVVKLGSLVFHIWWSHNLVSYYRFSCVLACQKNIDHYNAISPRYPIWRKFTFFFQVFASLYVHRVYFWSICLMVTWLHCWDITVCQTHVDLFCHCISLVLQKTYHVQLMASWLLLRIIQMSFPTKRSLDIRTWDLGHLRKNWHVAISFLWLWMHVMQWCIWVTDTMFTGSSLFNLIGSCLFAVL